MGMSNLHNCWNCGGPGIPHTGSAEICPKCEVTWRPYAVNSRQLNDCIVFKGVVIDLVDFTKPGAPSCP